MARQSKQRTLEFDTQDVLSGVGTQDPGSRNREPGATSQGPGAGTRQQATSIQVPNPQSAIRNPQSPSPGQTVYLVDAHSLIYQVFHALPEMSGPSGQPVGAVHGFVRDIVDLIEVRGADYVVAAFDHPGPTFRHELCTTNTRSSARRCRPIFSCKFRSSSGSSRRSECPCPALAGFEADDILATLARQVEAAGIDCYLVTSDKDCRQLISDRVKMFNIRKGEVFDAAALLATWGIRPDQVIDFQSLVGDKVDNIPGVPLIGPKNAQELLTKYQTLEGVLDHAHEVAGAKRKENLINGRELALKSRDLVRLKTDVPIEIDWAAARVGRFQPELVEALCRECGFRQLARRLETLAGKLRDLSRAGEESLPANAGLVGDAVAPAPQSTAAELTTATSPAWNATYKTIATRDGLQWLAAELSSQKQFVIDTETTAIQPRWAEIVGYSFCWQPGEAYYVPVRAPAGEPQLDPAEVLAALAARARESCDRQDRPEPKVRHGRAAISGRRIARRGIRHDGGRLPARPGRAEPQHGRHGPPPPRPSDNHDRPAHRQRQEPEADGRSAGRSDYAICRRRRRRAVAAGRAARSAAGRAGTWTSCSTGSKCR